MDWGRVIKEYHARVVYYIIFFGTVLLGGFIFYDLTNLIACGQSDVFVHREMAELYIKCLLAFGGYREIMRWASKGNSEQLGHIYYKKIVRGDRIVCFWILTSFVLIAIKQLLLIPRMPHELLYITEWSMYVFLGTRASKNASKRLKWGVRYKRGRRSAALDEDDEDFRFKVVGYITTNDSITNEECQKEFNLNKNQASYKLRVMVRKKFIKGQGRGKARKYVLGEAS